MDLGLKNKHVLVTGSSRCIGLAIAKTTLVVDGGKTLGVK